MSLHDICILLSLTYHRKHYNDLTFIMNTIFTTHRTLSNSKTNGTQRHLTKTALFCQITRYFIIIQL